jgi:hypothetical protein
MGQLGQVDLTAVVSGLFDHELSNVFTRLFLDSCAIFKQHDTARQRGSHSETRVAKQAQFITLDSCLAATRAGEAKASRIGEQIEANETMALAEGTQERF